MEYLISSEKKLLPQAFINKYGDFVQSINEGLSSDIAGVRAKVAKSRQSFSSNNV